MVSRAVVKLVNDGTKLQALQLALLDGETRDQVERFQQYGFTSVPQQGAEGVVLFIGGDRAHGVVVAVDDRRYRLKGLQNGEVAVYTDQGDSIVLKRGGVIEFNASSSIRLNGAATANTPVAKEGSMTTGHTHVVTGTAGPFPVAANAVLMTDSIAVGAGSQTVKVP